MVSAAETNPSPYAGQETRSIKALSERDTADLLAGRGMGYALSAELNRYPGPLHVIELADKLGLSTEQLERINAAFSAMQAQAKTLGGEIVAAERQLDTAFADGTIDRSSLSAQTAQLGQLYGRLRAIHLAAHLDMKSLLTSQQITAYDHLRGYSAPAPGAAPAPHKHGHH